MKNFYFNVFTALVFELHIVAGVLAKENFVADFEEVCRIATVFADAAFTERYDSAFLGFFPGSGIRNHDAGRRDLLFFERPDDDAVADGLEVDCELDVIFCHSRKEKRVKEVLKKWASRRSIAPLAVGIIEC